MCCFLKCGITIILMQSRRGTYETNHPRCCNVFAKCFEFEQRNATIFSDGSVTSLKPCDLSPADRNLVSLRQRLTVFVNHSRPKDLKTAQVAAAEAPLLVPANVYCASSVK